MEFDPFHDQLLHCGGVITWRRHNDAPATASRRDSNR
jgi:hypothetical protein